MSDIRLSPKHGVNPSVWQCYVCGEDVGVVLFGRLKGDADAEAPHRTVLDKAPCAKCADWMAKGVILISTRDGESGDNPHRTGGWCVLTEDAVKRMLNPGGLRDRVLRARMSFVPDSVWDAMGLPRKDVATSTPETRDS